MWKIYGPDLSTSFGALQGTGGLEAIIDESSGEIRGVVSDLLGDAVASFVHNGEPHDDLQWNRNTADPFGQPTTGSCEQDAEASASKQLVTESFWRTRRIDPTGLYNLGACYYDPSTHRFLSADPEGFGKGVDLYSYANGDPINYLDPDGRLLQAAWGVRTSQQLFNVQASQRVMEAHHTRISGGLQAVGGAAVIAG